MGHTRHPAIKPPLPQLDSARWVCHTPPSATLTVDTINVVMPACIAAGKPMSKQGVSCTRWVSNRRLATHRPTCPPSRRGGVTELACPPTAWTEHGIRSHAGSDRRPVLETGSPRVQNFSLDRTSTIPLRFERSKDCGRRAARTRDHPG